MIETLKNIDQQLFFLINRGFTNSFFDFLLPLMRSKYFWAPLYLFLITYLLKTNNTRKGLWTIGFLLITFALTDFISASIIKESVQRFRPCNDPEIMGFVRNIVGCGNGYSFVSSHAANHFGLAIFLGLYFKEFNWVGIAFKIWASVIIFSQVYVGVHYPLDVLCGMILGIGIAHITFYIYSRIVKV